MMVNKKAIFFLSVLAAAFFLRLLGINYGLPDLSHPDEARVILDTLSMGHRMSLLPERPDYALLYRYCLLFLYGLYFLIGKGLGIFKDSFDFALKFMVNPANIYLISRFVSAIFGVATGLAAYFLGKRIFKKEEIGICAFVFTLFEFQLLQHSQWAIYPIILCFFTLPAFYFIFRLIQENNLKEFIFAGVFCGLAISVQNQGIYLLPSLFLAIFLNYRKNCKECALKLLIKRWALLFGSLIVFSLLGNFYWFFIFKKSLVKTLELMGVTQVGFSSQAAYNYNFFSMFFWYIREIIRQDLVLGLLIVGGIVFALIRRTKTDLVFLIFLFVSLMAVSKWGFRILHDVISTLPIACVFAARFFSEAADKFIKKKFYYPLLSCLIVLPLAYDSFNIDCRKIQKDTRLVAKEWIENNIATTSKIATDWPVYSVPLKSRIPFLFRNPIALKYFETKIPAELRQRYYEYLGTQKTYQLSDIMYSTEQPVWPEDMPEFVIKKAKQRYVYQDLYSRFNFKTFDALKKERIDYIIITSYAWGFFLFDNDPNKKNLFNPFIKDRPELNYRHGSQYIDDNRHGIIFYLVKQGRGFYEALLDNRRKDYQLLKEFYPTNNLGPTIKIYKSSGN